MINQMYLVQKFNKLSKATKFEEYLSISSGLFTLKIKSSAPRSASVVSLVG